jgi:hypothetical protein
MVSGDQGVSASTQDSPSLRVLSGEAVLLSPESDRFRNSYRAVQPHTALAQALGFSRTISAFSAVANAVQAA